MSTEQAASSALSRRTALIVHAGADDGSAPATIASALLERGWHVVVITGASGEPRADAALVSELRGSGVGDHRFLGSDSARMAGREPRRYRSAAAPSAPGDEDRNADRLATAEPGELAAHVATVIATEHAGLVVGLGDLRSNSGADASEVALAEAARHAATVMQVRYTQVDNGRPDAVAGAIDGRSRNPVGSIAGSIAGFALAAAGGAAIGALGTVAFQADVDLLGTAVPVGLIAGLVVVAALLAGLRLLADNRLVPGAAAVGLLATIALLSLESPGGSILIPATPLAYYWLYGPVVIVALVLAWPNLSRARDAKRVGPRGSARAVAPESRSRDAG